MPESTSTRSVPPSASVNLRNAQLPAELAKLKRNEFSFDRLLVLADLGRSGRYGINQT